MVELQSCGSLANASAFCAIDQEVRGETSIAPVNAIEEISAELQREREKNAQLMKRISALEAQIQDKHKESFFTFSQGSCLNATERSIKKFKRQKLGSDYNGIEERNVVNGEIATQIKQDTECNPPKDHTNVIAGKLVNWMSMDDTQFLHTNKLKDEDLIVDCDDTDDSDEEYDCEESVDTQTDRKNEDFCMKVDSVTFKTDLPKQDLKETVKLGSISSNRKPPKMAFCPKEVKGILESEILSSKNAQTHTIRKIIVFASLGTRHGCDDMYELDFNHFSIQRRGEPYVSPNDPGEHVLYENPGVRRKMFFPNHQNPILCPVWILEEEKAMRPVGPSCPSCLFLCIKYGGRTRNLPQNEYVRQRMGRNKLKSFGPIMCRMAMLVHVRSGSFFFKALGITLLFMAGFPDDLVQRETKYRNLDLLQKYYRTDEDAEGEELFHPHPLICDTGIGGHQKLIGKAIPTKSKGKKQSKPEKCTKSTSIASTSASPTQFGLMAYSSIHQNQAMAAKLPIDNSATDFRYKNQNPCHIFPSQPANAFMPMVYWSAPNTFPPPNPYASAYGYQAFPPNLNYISLHPQTYYSHPSLIPKMLEKNWKNSVEEEAGSDSDRSASSTGPNMILANSS